MSTWKKIQLTYFLCWAIFFIVLSYFIFHTQLSLWNRISLWLFGFVAIWIAGVITEGVLRFFISKELQEKYGHDPFVVRWKTKEFDQFVGADLIELYEDSQALLKWTGKQVSWNLTDYSFVVLPMAKAYEGVLKKILVEAGLIQESELLENPDISINSYFNPVGNNSIFNSLKDRTRDKTVPHIIYSTYQECRNQILHYDPYRDNRINNIEDAMFYIRRIDHAIDKAYTTFKKVK